MLSHISENNKKSNKQTKKKQIISIKEKKRKITISFTEEERERKVKT